MKKFVSFALVLCLAISMFAITAAACSRCTADSYVYRVTGYVKGTYVNLRGCHDLADHGEDTYVIRAGLHSGDELAVLRKYVPSTGLMWYYVTVRTSLSDTQSGTSYVGKSGWIRSDLITLDYTTEQMNIEEVGEFN